MTDTNITSEQTTETCPVCGEEFGDGFGDISEGQTVDDARICVIEKNEDDEMADGIIHLPWEVGDAPE